MGWQMNDSYLVIYTETGKLVKPVTTLLQHLVLTVSMSSCEEASPLVVSSGGGAEWAESGMGLIISWMMSLRPTS